MMGLMLHVPKLSDEDLESTRRRSEELLRAGDLTPSERLECERWYSVADELLTLRKRFNNNKDR